MVLLRIFVGCGDVKDAGTPSSSTSLCLSAANEASHRCMLEMSSVQCMQVQAELYEEDEKLLCSSGPVVLLGGDDDWVCLKTTTASDGGLYKLKSCIRDCGNGWTLCFDVKERPDSTAILTHVRMAWVRPTPTAATAAQAAGDPVLAPLEKEGSRSREVAQDFTDPEQDDHPMHRRLLQLYHQPGPDMLNPAFWLALVPSTLTLNPGMPFAKSVCSELPDQALRTKRDLSEFGYGRLPKEAFSNLDICLSDLAAAMGHLQERGFPPVFIFLYDQPWQLLLRLFQAVQVLLEPDVRISLSVFAWALQAADAETGRVGSNFGRAHRDKSYADCHFPDARLGMLTTWIPLVPVTTRNGCMHVVPAMKDPLLSSSEDPKHLRPDDSTEGLGEALPCDEGETLVWRANLLHWGSACVDGEPRKSLATAFVVPGVRAADVMETMSQESLAAGLGLETRLRIVVKSLLQYRSWFPDFAGLSFD